MSSNQNFFLSDVTGTHDVITINHAAEAGGSATYLHHNTTIGEGGAARNLDVTGDVTVSGNISGTFTGTVQNNANLTGEVTSTGNAATITAEAVTAAKLAPD